MNADLKAFIQSTLCAVVPALLLVAATAFITTPFVLGHHPGDPVTRIPAVARHMT